MRRIKFVRQLNKFFQLTESKHLIKDFDDLIEQLPRRNLDPKDLKESISKSEF